MPPEVLRLLGLVRKVTTAIRVLPFDIAKGELGHHYRWGWKEKNKAGESLVKPDIEHRYNLPAGQSYDYEGKGLIIDNESDASPFGNNPLDTLKNGTLNNGSLNKQSNNLRGVEK